MLHRLTTDRKIILPLKNYKAQKRAYEKAKEAFQEAKSNFEIETLHLEHSEIQEFLYNIKKDIQISIRETEYYGYEYLIEYRKAVLIFHNTCIDTGWTYSISNTNLTEHLINGTTEKTFEIISMIEKFLYTVDKYYEIIEKLEAKLKHSEKSALLAELKSPYDENITISIEYFIDEVQMSATGLIGNSNSKTNPKAQKLDGDPLFVLTTYKDLPHYHKSCVEYDIRGSIDNTIIMVKGNECTTLNQRVPYYTRKQLKETLSDPNTRLAVGTGTKTFILDNILYVTERGLNTTESMKFTKIFDISAVLNTIPECNEIITKYIEETETPF